jgi:signal transduction histidine kinase
MLKKSFVFILLICFSCGPSSRSHPDLTQYQFRETRDLVAFVNDAAALFSAKGKGAFAEFGKQGGKWFSGSRYIFIYDVSGVCVFHPVVRSMIGKNLLDLPDLNGKPIGHFIHNIAFNSKKPYGWIHYLWAEPGEIFPSWKNAYIVGVRGPDGKTYAIGSGTYTIRTEFHFIVDIVDSAARLVRQKGNEAYVHLLDPASAFTFSNTYVFVLATDGRLLVDPAYPANINRNVIGFKDFSGQLIIRQMLKRMKKEEVVSISYMWPVSGQANPVKKMIYARKVLSGTDTVIVGSSLYLMEPIWKKF